MDVFFNNLKISSVPLQDSITTESKQLKKVIQSHLNSQSNKYAYVVKEITKEGEELNIRALVRGDSHPSVNEYVIKNYRLK